MRPRNFTERLASASARRKWLVLGAWMLAVLASAAAIGGLLGSALTTDDDFTGSPEAERAEQVLERAFPPVRADEGFRVDEAVIVSSPRATAGRPALRAASATRSPPTCAPPAPARSAPAPSRTTATARCCSSSWARTSSRSSSASSPRTGTTGSAR